MIREYVLQTFSIKRHCQSCNCWCCCCSGGIKCSVFFIFTGIWTTKKLFHKKCRFWSKHINFLAALSDDNSTFKKNQLHCEPQ